MYLMNKSKINKNVNIKLTLVSFIEDHYPEISGALISGSYLGDDFNNKSDYDIVVFSETVFETKNEKIKEGDFFIDTLILPVENIYNLLINDSKSFEGILINMISKGEILIDNEGLISKIIEFSKNLNSLGRKTLTVFEKTSYLIKISKLLEEIISNISKNEKVFVLFRLIELSCQYILYSNNKWGGTGKHLLKNIKGLDSDFYEKISNAIQTAIVDNNFDNLYKTIKEKIRNYDNIVEEYIFIGNGKHELIKSNQIKIYVTGIRFYDEFVLDFVNLLSNYKLYFYRDFESNSDIIVSIDEALILDNYFIPKIKETFISLQEKYKGFSPLYLQIYKLQEFEPDKYGGKVSFLLTKNFLFEKLSGIIIKIFDQNSYDWTQRHAILYSSYMFIAFLKSFNKKDEEIPLLQYFLNESKIQFLQSENKNHLFENNKQEIELKLSKTLEEKFISNENNFKQIFQLMYEENWDELEIEDQWLNQFYLELKQYILNLYLIDVNEISIYRFKKESIPLHLEEGEKNIWVILFELLNDILRSVGLNAEEKLVLIYSIKKTHQNFV